mmetsp:Transcript_38943/g.44443  ORF Transcript_38943/g.44443 Transcript_38943/m.44443 type:complete len:363 (-) Transcript_38943:32-1120(-)|eukprot:CAMPEP_0194154854 /NCGR_PEP_ID=MMETSP0152-20130528/62252_1 /TAXON_ID=1049557 /ORGANISM="Thalassiothrix antarctica, Strain L6-D1" /LENGTH=362 /DNA_ID=CAMNT_0038861271 /DNA_START=40 /DNA_END=1128 /DNA_ORIENTATION=-
MDRRNLTFLDPNDGTAPNETLGFVLAFSVLSLASSASLFQGLWETSRKHYLYNRDSLKILFPWASFVQVLENATLACDVSGLHVSKHWSYIVYALQATVPPSLLLSTFDVTYSIHKTRSVQFCGIVDGQSRSKNPKIVWLLKVLMRILALLLLAIGIVVNFDIIDGGSNPLAGRIGWYYLITESWEDEKSFQALLAILPIGISSIASFYFSIALWRYGTTYSMVVHASPFNPWFSPFFGTIALLGGQFFNARWFPLLSNLGIFVFIESMLLLFMEVNKDMEANTEIVDFLDEICVKRNEQAQVPDSSLKLPEHFTDEEVQSRLQQKRKIQKKASKRNFTVTFSDEEERIMRNDNEAIKDIVS